MKNKFLLFGVILANLCSVNLHGAKKRHNQPNQISLTDQTIYNMITQLSLLEGMTTVATATSAIIDKINTNIKPENDATISTQLIYDNNNAVNLLINKFIETGKQRFSDVFTSLIKALDNCSDIQFDTFLNANCINLALKYAESSELEKQTKVKTFPTKKSRAQFIIEELLKLKKSDRIFQTLALGNQVNVTNLLIESIKKTKPKYLFNILISEIKKAFLENSKTLVQAILDVFKINANNIEINQYLHSILTNIVHSPNIKIQASQFINDVYLPLQSKVGDIITKCIETGYTIAHLLANLITDNNTIKDFIDPLKNALVELVKQAPLILTITNNENKTPLSIIKEDKSLISKLKSALTQFFQINTISPGLANVLAQLIVIDPNNTTLLSYFEEIRNKDPLLLTSKTDSQASALEIIAKSEHDKLISLTKSIIDKIKDVPSINRVATQVITTALAAEPTNKGLLSAATYIANTTPNLLLPNDDTPSPLISLAESKSTGADTMFAAIVQAISLTKVSREQIEKILLETEHVNPKLAETIQATVKKLIANSPEAERAPLAQAVANAIMHSSNDQSPTSPLIVLAQAFVQAPENPENISILKFINEDGLVKKFGEESNKKSIIDVLVTKISDKNVLNLLSELVIKVLSKAQYEGKDLSSVENVANILGMNNIPTALMTTINDFTAKATATKELNGKLTQLKTHLTELKNKLQNLNTKLKYLKNKLTV